MKHRLAALAAAALALPAAVHAQSVTRTDECAQYGGEGDCAQWVSTLTVNLNIPGADAGKPGAIFIGARATNGAPGNTSNINHDTLGLWLFNGSGWVQFNGGAYTAAEAFSYLPQGRAYVVVDRQNLCQFAQGSSMELWVGYGVLQPDKKNAIDTYYTVKNPRFSPDHLRSVFVYNDMKDAGKYWNVMSIPAGCDGVYNGGAGNPGPGGYGGGG